MNYIIVTPAKNEADFIRYTLDSVVKQTLSPIKWIIVDDGSTDETAVIVKEYLAKHKWIEFFQTPNSEEKRSGGSKVVKAFYAGYERVKDINYDFIVKLDADLSLPNNYFAEVAKTFLSDEKIGLCGGYTVIDIGGKLVMETPIGYHIRGAFKSVRKKCFEDIGGFRPIWNWDGIDEMTAMYKGWKTKCFEMEVKHLRPTSSSYNLKSHAYKSGYEAYKMRMAFPLMILRALYNIFNKPFILNSVIFVFGYFSALIKREGFLIDKDLANFINNFHYKRILKLLK